MTTTQGPAPLSIAISEEAAHHVKEFAAAEGNPEADLRVGVKGGGNNLCIPICVRFG